MPWVISQGRYDVHSKGLTVFRYYVVTSEWLSLFIMFVEMVRIASAIGDKGSGACPGDQLRLIAQSVIVTRLSLAPLEDKGVSG